jgi:hypothetical protein
MTKQWEAQWISDPRFIGRTPIDYRGKEHSPLPEFNHPEELLGVHMLVRHSFHLTHLTNQAWLEMTADDYYKLWVNDSFVAQGPAQGFSHHYPYNRLDVTPYLKQGENVIAVHVYYQGLRNRAFNSADLRQGMIAELYADGRLAAASGPEWRYRIEKAYGIGKRIGYDTQFCELIDERLRDPSWRKPDYDDSDWLRAEPDDGADYNLIEQYTPPVQVYRIKPARTRQLSPGRYFIDFGQEVTGQFTMRATGEAGDTIDIYCGEELAEDGTSVRYQLRCNCEYHDRWTLSGHGDTLELFDYKAFRYAEVHGPEHALDPDTFAAIVRHYPYDVEKAATFRSSEALLNDIWTLCANGVKYGSHEHYVDCPTREKGQYLGDNTIIGHSHMYLTGDARLFRKAIEDTARSSEICSGLMAVSPGHFMQEIADFSLQWPYQVLTYYRYTGDAAFVQAMLPVAEGMLAHFRQFGREDGLLETVTDKWNLVDWPENLRDGYDFPLTRPVSPGCHNVVNAFYYGAMATVQELRKIGGGGRSAEGREELDRLRNSFMNAFYHEETGLFKDAEESSHSSLHANAIPLFWGIVSAEIQPGIVEFLKSKRLSCGVYTAYFLLKGLAKAGEHAYIYDLLLSDDERSWGNMVKEGATTCFEAWGKEQKWNTSLCHPWASSPIPIIIEDLFGITPEEAGWSKIRFEPKLPDRLKEAELKLSLPSGVWTASWRNGKGTLAGP